MKIVLIILLTFTYLIAKSDETCYTVQLLSKSNTKENQQSLQKQSFDSLCKVMQIGSTLTVRCGCFDEKQQAKEKLGDFLQKYKDAMVSSTYRYRFDDIQKRKQSTPLEKTIISTIIQKEKKEPKKLFKEEKKVCYTVQLTSLLNTKSNIEKLQTTQYPQSCKMMQIGQTATIRCGCEDEKSAIEKSFMQLKELYPYAAITRTYKYRFSELSNEKSPKKMKKEQIKIKKMRTTSFNSSKEEELRLILQVFLYKGDLKNAYQVASIGYKRHPKSYYWNQKMAEISQWTNRSVQSMSYLRNMYNMEYNKKLENKLIKYGVASYQYEKIESLVINKAKNNPTEKNIDLMINVYKKIGEPEKVLSVLDKEYKKYPKKSMLLTKALALSLEIGDLTNAKKYVDILESKKPYSQKDAALISNYYYVTHNIEKAYESLNYVDTLNIDNIKDYVKYFELKSDLGWYLQDNKNAAKASEVLMKLDHARLVDYERISYVNKDSHPKLAAKASKKAYLKYRLTYLFYAYANSSINRGKYKDLKELMKEIEKANYPLSHESLFWVIKAKVYGHYKKRKSQEKALLKAIKIAPDNFNIRLILLNYYMTTNNHKKLKMALMNLDKLNLGSSYYLPLASAYYYLHDIDKASYYIQKLLYLDDPVIHMQEFRFMQAYIYQMQNNENAFLKVMNSLVKDFQAQAKENPKLMKQDAFLSNYLRAAINVQGYQKFSKSLKKAKKYLTKAHYRDLAYSFALKYKEKDKSKKIFNKIKHKELWLKFSNSLLFSDHSKIQNFLHKDLPNLAMGDASKAAESDGQKSLAQTIAFETLNKNNRNQNAYIQHLGLSKQRSDRFDIKSAYSNRDPLLQYYTELKNKLYLKDGYSMINGLDYYKNFTLDDTTLLEVPDYSLDGMLGFRKIYDQGSIELDFCYYNIWKTYMGVDLLVQRKLTNTLNVKVALKKNTLAKESTTLLLGGKKDNISLNVAWKFLASSTLDVTYEFAQYSSQDSVDLGSGEYMKAVLSHQIRQSYPDMKVALFYDNAQYDEKTLSSHGVIDNIQKSTHPVFSKDFYDIGLIFSYGMVNSSGYTRVWRPFAEFSPSYNSLTQNYTYGFDVGIGGRVMQQDHLVFGASYSESADGITGKIYELYIKYNFLYVHPKLLKGI